MSKYKYGTLHPLSFGLALGLLWAVALFTMATVGEFVGGYGLGFVKGIGTIYVGYGATMTGALIGAAWGFVDACVGGILVAWIYNLFCRGFGKSN
ncbi:MAG: bacteriophage holin [Gammaproteobacteria bacterium]|nr:bacteriophage holin [Gammaproteobacteria bacterium]